MFTVSWLAVSCVRVHHVPRVPNSMEGKMAPTKMQNVTTDETENTTSYGLVTWLVILAAGFFSLAPFITNYVVQ